MDAHAENQGLPSHLNVYIETPSAEEGIFLAVRDYFDKKLKWEDLLSLSDYRDDFPSFDYVVGNWFSRDDLRVHREQMEGMSPQEFAQTDLYKAIFTRSRVLERATSNSSRTRFFGFMKGPEEYAGMPSNDTILSQTIRFNGHVLIHGLTLEEADILMQFARDHGLKHIYIARHCLSMVKKEELRGEGGYAPENSVEADLGFWRDDSYQRLFELLGIGCPIPGPKPTESGWIVSATPKQATGWRARLRGLFN